MLFLIEEKSQGDKETSPLQVFFGQLWAVTDFVFSSGRSRVRLINCVHCNPVGGKDAGFSNMKALERHLVGVYCRDSHPGTLQPPEDRGPSRARCFNAVIWAEKPHDIGMSQPWYRVGGRGHWDPNTFLQGPSLTPPGASIPPLALGAEAVLLNPKNMSLVCT